MASRKALWAVVVASGLLGAPPTASAEADSLNDSMGPRAVGLGEALRASAAGAAATTLNPAGAALVRNYVIEGSYGFRGQDDATIAGVSVCDSVTARVAACLYYSYFSAAPEGGERAMHQAGLTLALPIAERILIGTTTKYVDYTESGSLTMPTDHSRSGDVLLDGGVIVKVAPTVNLALVGYNLIGGDEGNFPRGIGGGIAVYATPQLMFEADGVWNLAAASADRDTGRYGVGAEYFVTSAAGQAGYPIRIGYVYDVATSGSYLTGGVGYVTPRVGLDVGLRKQVSGDGDEMMVQLGLRLFLPN